MYDRAIQALYTLALNPYAEATADSTSFGFRKYRSAQHACATIFNRIGRKCDAQWILEGDIKGCFDNISHEWLLANIPMDKSMRLFNIFWDCQNLPLISLAIDCNQYKTRK
jgi:RNA-directed DNA polymerase